MLTVDEFSFAVLVLLRQSEARSMKNDFIQADQTDSKLQPPLNQQ